MKSNRGFEEAIAPESRIISRERFWRTLILALLVIGYTGYYLCRSNLSATVPLIIDSLSREGMDPATARIRLGTIASLGVLAYAIGKFFAGTLADFIGGKRNFLIGMGGAAAFTIWFAAGHSVPVLALAWIGNRLIQSLGWAGMMKISSKWFPSRSYGTMLALVSLSYLFGDALSRIALASLIAGSFSWRQIFVIAAIVLGTLLVICLLLLRESPLEVGLAEPQANPSNLFGKDGERHVPVSLASLFRTLFSSYAFWSVCALSLGTTLVRETFGLWTPAYFTDAAGFSPAEAAGKSALFPLLGGVSVILCGWLSDRLGPHSRAALVFVGLVLSGLVLLWLGLIPARGTMSVILVSLVAFLIIGPYSFLAGAMALDFGGKQGVATASGFIDGIGYLGGVLAGDTMARISITWGWRGCFLLLAGVAFAGSAAAAFYVRLTRKPDWQSGSAIAT
jgi:OPA family glycerol-3-phosphate transporter-like MFS transporter